MEETVWEKKDRLKREISKCERLYLTAKKKYLVYKKLNHIHGTKKYRKEMSSNKRQIETLKKEIKHIGGRN